MKSYSDLWYSDQIYSGQSDSEEFLIKRRRHHTEAHLLLEIYLDGRTLYLSDGKRTVDDYNYEGLVLDWGSMDIDQAGIGGMGSVGDYSLVLANSRLQYMTTDAKLSDAFDDYYWDNRQATVLQWFEGTGYGDCEIVFQGTIVIDGFDENEIKIDLVHYEADVNRIIPFAIINENDYSNVPQDNIGKVIPIVFGNLNKSFNTNDRLPFHTFSLAPLVSTNQAERQFHISSHDIDGVAGAVKVYMYSASLSHYIHLTGGGTISFYENNNEAYVKMAAPIKGEMRIICKEPHDSRNDVSDISALVDADYDNYITLNAGDRLSIRTGHLRESFQLDETLSTYIQFQIKYGYTTGGAGTVAKVSYRNDQYDEGVGGNGTEVNMAHHASSSVFQYHQFGLDKTAHGKEGAQADQNNPWQLNELGEMYCEILAQAGFSLRVYSVSLVCAHMLLQLEPSFEGNITAILPTPLPPPPPIIPPISMPM